MNTGFAFGEHIKTEKIKKRDYDDTPKRVKLREYLIPLILILAVGVMLVKLFHLQIVRGSELRILADSNRIRTKIIHAPRGVIFDRNGTPLVQNTPGFRKINDCHPEQSEGSKKDSSAKPQNDKICKKTSVLTKDQALPLIIKGSTALEVDSLREYPFKESMTHVLGYTGQISKEEIEDEEFARYMGTDWVGKSGIERQYEHILHGTDGRELVEVNAKGVTVRPLGTTDPIPGQDISLTIDAKLQNAAYTATKNVKRGAVIVSKPTGEILSMVSIPSYDPNLFTLDDSYKLASESAYKNIESVLKDGIGQPLLNRAVGGTYPPGSTYKIVTAVAGLENKIIDKDYRVRDTGVIKVGEFSFANWYFTNYGRTEPGELDVIRALARSNDIFFYKLAEKVGVDKLSEMAQKFGLGTKTGIDLGGEAKGLVPDPKWKESQIGESWYLGDTYHYGIGQGFLLTTPLQVNSFTEVIANGGTLYQPRLLQNQKSKIKNQKIVSESNISLIRQGMIDSCKTSGVAWPLFKFKVQNEKLKIDGKNILEVKEASGSAKAQDLREITIACKTGTAQHGGEETLPHAWITLFAPAYNPEIVVTVLNEESGEGSNEAAPIAKKILEAYFSGKK